MSGVRTVIPIETLCVYCALNYIPCTILLESFILLFAFIFTKLQIISYRNKS